MFKKIIHWLSDTSTIYALKPPTKYHETHIIFETFKFTVHDNKSYIQCAFDYLMIRTNKTGNAYAWVYTYLIITKINYINLSSS